jgi:hypothetical protein
MNVMLISIQCCVFDANLRSLTIGWISMCGAFQCSTSAFSASDLPCALCTLQGIGCFVVSYVLPVRSALAMLSLVRYVLRTALAMLSLVRYVLRSALAMLSACRHLH